MVARTQDLPTTIVVDRRRVGIAWPFVVAGFAAVASIAIASRESAPVHVELESPLAKLRELEPMAQLRAIKELPLEVRWSEDARMLARAAVTNGFVHTVALDADPIVDAATFARDGTLVIPTAGPTIAIARDGTRRMLPATPHAPRRVFLDERELRVLTDEGIFATPLDRIAWQSRGRCKSKRATANADLTMLACPGARIIIDGVPSRIPIGPLDEVAFAPNRIAVRRATHLDWYTRRSERLAQFSVTATRIAATDDLVAYVADGQVGLWDPATKESTRSFASADRIELIGGREPYVLASKGKQTSVLVAVRVPVLGVVGVDHLTGPAFVADARIVERAASEVIVRDYGAGRAWRQGAARAVVAGSSTVALFDQRTVRVWSLDVPPAATIRGLTVRTIDHSLIVSGPGGRSPLRAFAANGTLQHRIDTPAQLLDAGNALLVETEGKTAQWSPGNAQLVEVTDRVLDRGFLRDGDVHAMTDGQVARVRDGAAVCPGSIVSVTPDGSVALVISDGKLVACRAGSSVALSTTGGRASWQLRDDGRVAASVNAGALALFDTETGARISLESPRGVSGIAFAGDKLAIAATQGLFVLDGGLQLVSTEVVEQPRFVDVDHVIALRRGRIELFELSTRSRHELGSLASPTDAKHQLRALDGHAIASSQHLTTGVVVSLPIAPPDPATLERWLAHVR